MYYNVYFEQAALVFMMIIGAHFVTRPWLPSKQNRLFRAFLIIGFCSIALDIATAYTIHYSQVVPLWVNMLLNSAFYALQIAMPAMLYLYVMCLAQCINEAHRNQLLLVLMPAIVCEVGVLVNPMTDLYFYFDEHLAYHHGAMYPFLLILTILYMALSLYTAVKHSKRIWKPQHRALFIMVPVTAAALIIQTIYPQYLLTDAVLAAFITMVYLTLQNPAETTDELTGLFNRSAFVTFTDEQNEQKKKQSLIVLALDDMRRVNNTFGVNEGNVLLRQVGQYLRTDMKRTRLFRLFSDYFVILCRDAETCDTLTQRLCERFQSPWPVGGMPLMLSACICRAPGVYAQGHEGSVVMLVEYAMAMAKKRGPGTLLEVDEQVMRTMRRELDVSRALDDALKKDELEVYLQPIYHTGENAFTAAEALVRFHHDTLGVVAPDEFIPIAEKNGLIVQLGAQVLDKVCKFMYVNRICEREDFEWVEINLSSAELLRQDLPDSVMEILTRYRIDPSLINFEVTETIAATGSAIIKQNMEALCAQGVGFSVDDFGKGYANLDCVMTLPFSAIKLDRGLLMQSMQSQRSRILVSRLIDMARALGMALVAEGAETPEQAEQLCALGAERIQGFHYAKPMPMDEYLRFLVTHDIQRSKEAYKYGGRYDSAALFHQD